MAEEVFLIKVVLDASGAQNQSKRVRDELGKTETAADGVNRALKRAFTVASIGLAIRQAGRLADAYTRTQNRLKTVTEGSRELSAATAELFEIADDTRQAYAATVEIYSRVGLAAKDLGRDQEELLQFTESLNQAVALSGAAGQEARAGIIQLSQGLASGALRGDELRSVLEQLPVVADVIAKAMGVTRGELRELGSEGKISAEIVLDAFKEAREELDERFGKSVPTLAQSFEVLNNNMTRFVGETDKVIGASAALSTIIIGIAENLDVAAGGTFVLATVIVSAYIPATATATTVTAGFATAIGAVTAAAAAEAAVFAALGVAVAVATNRAVSEFEELQRTILETTEAGEKFALTEFGKVGADIAKVEQEIRRVSILIAQDVASGQEANQSALATIERLRGDLARLRAEQERLADGTAKTTVEAQAQSKALRELDSELRDVIDDIELENRLLLENSREREIQKTLLKEIADLQKDSPDLSPQQRAELEASIRTNAELAERAEVLERIRGPQEKFGADLAALNTLLDEGTISEQEYTDELNRMAAAADGVDFSALDIGSFSGQVDGFNLEKFLELVRGAQAASAIGPALPPGPDFSAGISDFGPRPVDEPTDAERQATLLRDINAASIELSQTQSDLNALFEAGAISSDEYRLAMNDARIAADRLGGSFEDGLAVGLAKVENKLRDTSGVVSNAVVSSFNAASDAIVDFAVTGEFELNSFLETLKRIAAEVAAQQLLLALLPDSNQSGGKATQSGEDQAVFAALQIAGSFFAKGGDFPADEPFIAGEEGPELITPKGAGTVTPAGETAALLQGQRQAAGAPVVNVPAPQVNNFIIRDPNEITEMLRTPEGKAGMMNFIQEERRTVKQTVS